MTRMSDFEAVSICEGFCGGEDATPEQQQEAWQHIIDNGLVWQLQGWFGRTANDLIQQGICQPRHRRQA